MAEPETVPIDVITMDSPKESTRGWKPCKCNECGKVAICTPATDFYIEDADMDKEIAPLYCWKCLIDRNNKTPKKPIKVEDEPLYTKKT